MEQQNQTLGRSCGEFSTKIHAACGAEAVIPTKSNQNTPRDYDKDLYKERNLIERIFNKLKYFRRVATRYDKTA
jgi:transposase